MSLPTLGIRHVALNVSDAQRSKAFYMRVLQMQLEWEPDADNVYLTSGGLDNLAIHKGSPTEGSLDHLGVAVPTIDAVDLWYAHIKSEGAKIVREIKTHRDGARSFYFADPDGIVTQVIYHIPIAERARGSSSA